MTAVTKRIDDFDYENWNQMLSSELVEEDPWFNLTENEKFAQIGILEQSLVEKEYVKCLKLLYVIFPSLFQPIFKQTKEINNVIENLLYKSISDEQLYQYARIYDNLYDYFWNCNFEDSDQLCKDNPLTLLNYSLIIDSTSFLIYVLSFHLIFALLISLFLLTNYVWFIVFLFEIWNIMHVTMDMIEQNQWNTLFVIFYDWIYVMSQFETQMNRCLTVLSNYITVNNGYSLCSDTRNIPIHKLDTHDNDAKNKLNDLRKQIFISLTNTNNQFQNIIYQLSNRQNPNNLSNVAFDNLVNSLSLQQLYQKYQYYRVCRKLFLTQLNRITDVYCHSYYIYKSVRKYLYFGCVFYLKCKSNNGNEAGKYEYYLNSPFSPTVFHMNLNVFSLIRMIAECMMGQPSYDTNTSNKLIEINGHLNDLSNSMRTNISTLVNMMKLNKSPQTLDQLKNIELKRKLKSAKAKNMTRNNEIVGNNEANLTMADIENSLKRLQSKIDEITCHIYKFDQIIKENPQSIADLSQKNKNDEEMNDECETKLKNDENNTEIDTDNDNETETESMNNVAFEVLENLVRRLHSSYNEWKFIVSNIDENNELLSKYPGFGQSTVYPSWMMNGKQNKNKYKRHLMDETVLAYDEKDNKIESEENSEEKQKQLLMATVLSKLQSKSKSSLKSSIITEDGEEMFEDEQDYSVTFENNEMKNNNENDEKFDISLNRNVKNDISFEPTFVNELESVLKHRKKINKKKFDENKENEDNKQCEIEKKEKHSDDEPLPSNNEQIQDGNEEEIFEIDSGNRSKAFAFNSLMMNAALNRMNQQMQAKKEKEKEKEKQNKGKMNFGNDVGLLAALAKENEKERNSVLNGTCNDFEIEFKMNEDEIVLSDNNDENEMFDINNDNNDNNELDKEEKSGMFMVDEDTMKDMNDANENDTRDLIMNRPTIGNDKKLERRKRMRQRFNEQLLSNESKTRELKAMTEAELGDNTTLSQELANERLENNEMETMDQILNMNGIDTTNDEYANDINDDISDMGSEIDNIDYDYQDNVDNDDNNDNNDNNDIESDVEVDTVDTAVTDKQENQATYHSWTKDDIADLAKQLASDSE